MAGEGGFSGFPEEGIPFLLELQALQDRAWFKAHQGDFNRYWKEPLEQLVGELTARLGPTYGRLGESKPHYFRIQRDTRFARDKSPYKDYVAVGLPVRPDGSEERPVPSLYLSFGVEQNYVGMGVWHTSPPLLARYRAALDDGAKGAKVQGLVDELLADEFTLESIDTLKRVPSPYPQDHPRAELLKRKGLAMGREVPDDLLYSAALVDFCAETLARVGPLSRWLERELADSEQGPA
jgi:uncharacterized protein (TIGR02453 family)